MYLTIYVNDTLIACGNFDYVKEVKKRLCSTFDMTDIVEFEHFFNV